MGRSVLVTSLGPMCARDGVVSVPYSPDGTQIVSCSNMARFLFGMCQEVLILDPLEDFVTQVERELWTKQNPKPIPIVAFSPDGTRIGRRAKGR